MSERVVDRERMKQRELENLVISLITPNIIDRYQSFKINDFKNIHSNVIDQIRKFIPNVLRFSFINIKNDFKDFH